MKNVLGDIFLKKQKIMDEKCPWGHFSEKTKNYG